MMDRKHECLINNVTSRQIWNMKLVLYMALVHIKMTDFACIDISSKSCEHKMFQIKKWRSASKMGNPLNQQN